MTVCPEEESILMTSFVDTLSRLHGKEGEPSSQTLCSHQMRERKGEGGREGEREVLYSIVYNYTYVTCKCTL